MGDEGGVVGRGRTGGASSSRGDGGEDGRDGIGRFPAHTRAAFGQVRLGGRRTDREKKWRYSPCYSSVPSSSLGTSLDTEYCLRVQLECTRRASLARLSLAHLPRTPPPINLLSPRLDVPPSRSASPLGGFVAPIFPSCVPHAGSGEGLLRIDGWRPVGSRSHRGGRQRYLVAPLKLQAASNGLLCRLCTPSGAIAQWRLEP